MNICATIGKTKKKIPRYTKYRVLVRKNTGYASTNMGFTRPIRISNNSSCDSKLKNSSTNLTILQLVLITSQLVLTIFS